MTCTLPARDTDVGQAYCPGQSTPTAQGQSPTQVNYLCPPTSQAQAPQPPISGNGTSGVPDTDAPPAEQGNCAPPYVCAGNAQPAPQTPVTSTQTIAVNSGPLSDSGLVPTTPGSNANIPTTPFTSYQGNLPGLQVPSVAQQNTNGVTPPTVLNTGGNSIIPPAAAQNPGAAPNMPTSIAGTDTGGIPNLPAPYQNELTQLINTPTLAPQQPTAAAPPAQAGPQTGTGTVNNGQSPGPQQQTVATSFGGCPVNAAPGTACAGGGTVPDCSPGAVTVQTKGYCDAQIAASTEKGVTYKGTDDCDVSSSIGYSGGGGCKGVRTMITTTQITTAVAQQVGSQALNVAGQNSIQNAMISGASMATIYENSASMARTAAQANVAMGAAQGAMGVLETMQSNKHNKLAKAFDAKFTPRGDEVTSKAGAGGTGAANGAILEKASEDMGEANQGNESTVNQVSATVTGGTAKFGNSTVAAGAIAPGVNGNSSIQNQADIQSAKNLASSANSLSKAAVGEQKNVSEAASAAGMTDIAKGGAAVVSGAFQWASADKLEALYKAMANAPTATAPGADPFAAQTTGATGANTITGSGNASQSAASAAASPAPVGSGGPLGPPLGNPLQNTFSGVAPSPDPMAAGNGSSSGGSGSGVGGAIGTSAAPPGNSDDPTAKYASNGGGTTPYEGVGGYGGGAGGGGGRGNSNDPSIDPKALMAAMLDQMNPKKDDPTGQDIRDYRSLASDNYAPLPQSEEVFGYIHKAYQQLQTKGRVGLN